MTMTRLIPGLLAAGACMLATAARADDLPYTPGNYADVTDISIDDGHFLDYMKFVDSEAKAEDAFAISQGWEISLTVYANVFKRKGEGDIFLMRTMKSLPDAAEQQRRDKIMEDHFKKSEADFEAGSGARASFRHIGDEMLLQELILK